MTTTLMTYGGSSQSNHSPIDQGRIELQHDILNFLKNEDAEVDLVKQSQFLLSKYPNLASLKSRIKYPEEIAKVDVTDLTKLIAELEDASKRTNEIGTELLQLAGYYRDFQAKYNGAPANIRAVLLSPKAKIEGDLISPHRVTQETARKILSRNRYGDIVKQNVDGNHPVVAVNCLHLKSASDHEPLDTGMEISVYLLHTLLFGEELGPGLAPSSLLTLDDVEIEEPAIKLAGDVENRFEEASGLNRRGSFFRRHQIPLAPKPHAYVVQASKTIEGRRLDDVMDDKISFDEENFSSLILASFLTIPSDNKPDNFMVTTGNGQLVAKIIGIDNDMAFAYPLTMYGDKKEHMIGLKNALYCFEKMMDKPVAAKVRARIAQLDPILLALEWGAAVIQQEQRYPQQKTNQANLPVRFTKDTLHNLIENLQMLQKILANPDLKDVTHRELFRLLFPVVERYYQELSGNGKSSSKEKKSTSEKVEDLFSRKLPSVEHYLKKDEKLEDGRTIREALHSSDKRTFAYQKERDTSIEELCYEVLGNIDLTLLPPAKQCAILTLAARQFPQLVNKEFHSSWNSEALPFVLIHEKIDLNVITFLQKLGVDFNVQNGEGNTLLHLLVKQGQNLPKALLDKSAFEIRNNNGLTPLDIAMEQQHEGAFLSLIYAGAGSTASSSRAWELYNKVVKKKNNPQLTAAFQRLIKRNAGIYWKMARETIFIPEKEGGIPVSSAMYGKKALHPDAVKKLWDGDTFQSVNTTGKRDVGMVTLDGFTLYFKQAPELPGVEQAVGTLMHQIMGFGAPHTDLVMIKGMPYIVSQGISGQTLQEVLEKNPQQLKQLNKQRLSQQILMAMVTNPEDGKPDNLIVELHPEDSFRIVSIDNDHAFVPSMAKEKVFQDKKNKVQVKTILYCLDQMKDPIDPSVREQFLKHDPAVVLMQWLTHLSAVDSLYNQMFTQEERKTLLDKVGTFIGIPFRTEMVAELYRKMVKIQFILDQEKDNPWLTHIDLLNKLDPALGQRYSAGLNMQTSPMQRFLAVDGKDYDMKNGNLMSTRQAKEILQSYNIATKTDMKTLIQNGTALNAEEALRCLQDVVKADQKNLAQQIMSANGANVDFSFLSPEQVANILKKIDFSKLPQHVVQSILAQIRRFVFKELVLRNAAAISNSYLKELNLNQLTVLELPNCQGLYDYGLAEIIRHAPELRKLNLSGNRSLETVERHLVTSKRLDMNKITHLLLNQCSNLRSLRIKGDQLAVVECEDGNLRSLEIQSPSLSNLNLKNNKRLKDPNLEECPNLKRINLEGCDQITEKEFRERFPFYPVNIYTNLSDRLKRFVRLVLANSDTEMFLGAQQDDPKEQKVGNKGAIALALALRYNSTISKLVLSQNEIGVKGTKALAEALKYNSTLRLLDLSYNDIDLEGAKALAEALKYNSSLIELRVWIVENEVMREVHDFLSVELRKLGFISEGSSSIYSGGEIKYVRTATSDPSSSESAQLQASSNTEQKPVRLNDRLPIPMDPMKLEEISDRLKTPEALFSRGQVLEKTDLHEAIDLYLEAAVQKHEAALKRLEELSQVSHDAQYALGCYYEKSNDLPQAAFYYAMATAETHLQAKQALRRLAENCPEAKSHLAVLMQKGLGMKENMEQALNLHKQAAEQGVGLSQLHLGILYYMGRTGKEDEERALSLISQAESQGVPQAGIIKAQIQKEILEIQKLNQVTSTSEQALYLLANRKAGTDLFAQLPHFDKKAFSASQIKIRKTQQDALERDKVDLLEKISELENRKAAATSGAQVVLTKQIEDLHDRLRSLEKKQKVQGDPAEEARQFYLNQKRGLFYSGFSAKLCTVCEAVDAILSGEASRNIPFAEKHGKALLAKAGKWAAKTASSVVPGLGIVVDAATSAIEHYLTHRKEEEVNKQCRKIQAYYPEKGPKGVENFSTLLASGFVYRFQDHLPHLNGESIQALIEHCILRLTDYLYEKAPDDATPYELLLGGGLHRPMTAAIKDLFNKKSLKTNYGLVWTIEDLLFSTGVQTIYGGKYLPKDPKRRAFINEIEKMGKEHKKEYPIYRWGTKEEIEKLSDMGIEMECVEEERIGALATTIDFKKAAARYMQEAQSLSQQFLGE